ncbi:substrate-binding domain-containing protein [Planococcus sp. N028]|uniref:Substrate-binding domain-containing protein n=1 Tax=Planococcus shixiaomingii TaxID=3058393 RepID=A0ABT8N4Z9_9BACL|nr:MULTISPECIES: substrate-binding domain-containing protein [unclassified Planococcus (in: firmicutes)]MDN7242965.1 substrate-binding domain-containing protein [Planococcus sp. N028]WKA55409.1 substrate-binding domain-containing protein [Planococcus sp. N022]
MKNITIGEVAEQAKVSKSTVSQYLNKRYEYMSEATRKRIEAAIEELNYHPNIVARSLKQKSTFTVGVIVANILHSFSTQILRTIENDLNKTGFHVIICNADDQPEKERNYIEMLLAKQVDGLIIFPTGGNIDLYEQMKKKNFPVVFMDRKIEELGIDTVMLDNHQAARMAISEFVESDYTKISIITTSIIRNTSPRVERIEGYKAAMTEHGLPVLPEYIKTADAEDLQGVLQELFALEAPPEAILAGNDIVLIEVLKFAKEHRLAIPGDVAVIGIDEVSFASFYTPPITVVAQPTIKMANKATELLLEQINSENKTARTAIYRLQPSLIKRDSC